MLRFDEDGNAICYWEIKNNPGGRARQILEIPLSDWLALTKVTTTFEELRYRVFMFVEDNKRTKRAANGI